MEKSPHNRYYNPCGLLWLTDEEIVAYRLERENSSLVLFSVPTMEHKVTISWPYPSNYSVRAGTQAGELCREVERIMPR